MPVTSFQENAGIYLNAIGAALQGVVERCGGSLEGDNTLPPELVRRQRSLFIHTGITGLLSTAIMDHDVVTLSFFDWLLGYHINKERGDQADHDRFIVAVLQAFCDQVCQSYPDSDNPRFSRFLALQEIAFLVLSGVVPPEEFAEIDDFCIPLAMRGLNHQAEQRKNDAEKN